MELSSSRYEYLRGKAYAIGFMSKTPNKENGLLTLKDISEHTEYSETPNNFFYLGIKDYVDTLEARAAKAIDQVNALYPTTLDLMELNNYEKLIANHNKAVMKSWGKAGIKPILFAFTVLGLIVLALSNFQLF